MNPPYGPPYRHERLATGALQELESTHLHVDVASNFDVLRDLRNQLLQFGALVKEDILLLGDPPYEEYRGVLSLPVHFDGAFTNHLRLILRYLRDVDVRPCEVDLERVIACVDGKGTVRIADAERLVDWNYDFDEVDFEPFSSGFVEIHHSVKIPKRTIQPPFALNELGRCSPDLGPALWTIFQHPEVWSYHSRVFVQASAAEIIGNGELAKTLQRNHAALRSIFKEAGVDARFSIIAEELLNYWTDPLEPLEQWSSERGRRSFVDVTGTFDTSLPNFDDILAQCRQASPSKLLVRDEDECERIATNLDGFKRIVEEQRFAPIMMELSVMPSSGSDCFASQAIAFADSDSAAEATLESWRTENWAALQSGLGPLLSHPETSHNLYFWVSQDAGPDGGTENPDAAKVIAASEQIVSLKPNGQYRPVEETVQAVAGTFLPECFRSLGTALLAVPFDGERHRGCLFTRVAAPDLTEDRIESLAMRLSLMLHRAALKKTAVAISGTTPARPDVRLRTDLRVQQAKEHDRLWTAIESVTNEPCGVRLERMAVSHPQAFALFARYPALKTMSADIEHAGKITEIVEMSWKIISGTETRRLFEWRKKAGIPPRRHY